MKRLTKQEMFDKVALGILAQGGPSVRKENDGGWSCRYRGEDGRRCAAGQLLDDKNYLPRMEGKSVEWLLPFDKDKIKSKGERQPEFAAQLQWCHDNCVSVNANKTSDDDFMKKWKENMLDLAVREELDASVLTK